MAATTQRSGRWYTSRENAKAFIGIASTVSDKDAQVDSLIAAASVQIERETGRRFIPWTGTKEFDYQGTSQVVLGDDLLSVTTLDADGTTVVSTDYFLYPLNAGDDDRPYTRVEFNQSQVAVSFVDTKQSAINITGKWGYSELPRDTGATLNGAISDTTSTSFTASDGTLLDIGQTLLIDSEQMFVSNIATNTITVTRGMNGTTAATHSNSAAINVIEAPADIRHACGVLVAWGLALADRAYSDFEHVQAVPVEVRDTFRRYRRMVDAPVRAVWDGR